MPNSARASLTTFGMFICFLVQVALGFRLDALAPPTSTAIPAEVASRWTPALFKAVTFGHWTAGVDWLWIKTLSNPSIAHMAKGERAPIFYDLDLASDLDPAFFDIYYAGAHLLAVIRDDGEGARDILQKSEPFRKTGLANFPSTAISRYWKDEWTIPMLQAYVNLFELSDMKAAGHYFVEAAALPGSPQYLVSLAKRFEKPGGEYDVGLRLLNFMLTSAKTSEEKTRLEKKRTSLFLAQFLNEVNTGFLKFLRSRPNYSGSHATVPAAQLNAYWKAFRKEAAVPASDPFGGALSIDSSGRVVSTTPREKIFGLE
jgi:hypothetical protein